MKDNGNNKDDYIIEDQKHFDKTIKALLEVKPKKKETTREIKPPAVSNRTKT